MQTLPLFDLASRQANWLAARQSAIASNIANVNTPGYLTVDVAPFKEVLGGKTGSLNTTHARHSEVGEPLAAISGSQSSRGASSTGTSVDIESELMKEGEVHKAFELNTAIVKSFHRMIMSAIRSG
jgi:flagellar basal-body rod protein FlgB